MKERIITLYCSNQKQLEEHVRLLGNWLRNQVVLNQMTNGKISPFANNISEKDLEDTNHGIWILVEDYSTINPEIAIDFVSDINILLDGLICGDDPNRLVLLETADYKKWQIVTLDQDPSRVQTHIMDYIHPLM
jgi:hypothetical protein